MSEIKKCYICGAVEPDVELTNCVDCGKTICLESESCCEQVNNGDDPTCTKCIETYEKFNCNTCNNQNKEICPMAGFSYVYSCPEYVELTEELKIKNHLREILALELGISIEAVDDEYTLKDELEVDSLDAIELMMLIEDAYPCIEIEDSEAVEFEDKTVEELLEYLYQKINEVINQDEITEILDKLSLVTYSAYQDIDDKYKCYINTLKIKYLEMKAELKDWRNET